MKKRQHNSNASNNRMKNIFKASNYENGDALLIYPNLKGKCYGLRLLLTDSGHYLISAYDFSSKDQMRRRTIAATNLHAQTEHRSLTAHLATMDKEQCGGASFLVGRVYGTHHLDTTKGGTQPGSFQSLQSDDSKSKKHFSNETSGSHSLHTTHPVQQSTLRSTPKEVFAGEEADAGDHFKEDDVTKDENEFDNATCCSCSKEANAKVLFPCRRCARPTCPKCHRADGCGMCSSSEATAAVATTTTTADDVHAFLARSKTLWPDERIKALNLDRGMLRGWSHDYYDNSDCFEAALDSRKLRRKMSQIREEFYTHTQFPVVRPSNVALFFVHPQTVVFPPQERHHLAILGAMERQRTDEQGSLRSWSSSWISCRCALWLELHATAAP